MEKEIIKLIKKESVKKKPFNKVSDKPDNNPVLKQITEKMKIEMDFDQSIYREAMITDIVEKKFPQNISAADYAKEDFAETLPEVFKKLGIKCVDEVSKNFSRRTWANEQIPSLGLKVPDLDSMQTYALKEKVRDIYSGFDEIRNAQDPHFDSKDERKTAEFDIIAKNKRSVEIVYLRTPFSKGFKYNLFINFGDPESPMSSVDTYSREHVVQIIKIVDEIEKLNKK